MRIGGVIILATFLTISCRTQQAPRPQPSRATCYLGSAAPPSGAADKEQRGSLDKEAIRRVMKANLDAVRGCYQNLGLANDPSLAGRVEVAFEIANEGNVAWSRIASSSLGSRRVEDCIGQQICSYVFPKVSGNGFVLVKYPYVLAPTKASDEAPIDLVEDLPLVSPVVAPNAPMTPACEAEFHHLAAVRNRASLCSNDEECHHYHRSCYAVATGDAELDEVVIAIGDACGGLIALPVCGLTKPICWQGRCRVQGEGPKRE